MARAEYWVTPDGNKWKIVHNGKDFPYDTQAAAIEAARTAAHATHAKGMNAQVHVARPNGQWRTEWTYGDDPARYPG